MGRREGSKAAILLYLLVLIWAELVVGRFVVEKNSLRVISPDSIKGNYDSAIGNFGIPQYGGSMAGTVVYPKDNRNGCQKFDDFGISFKSKPGALPTFVLVDRGGICVLCCVFFVVFWVYFSFDFFGTTEGELALDLIFYSDILLWHLS